MSGPPPPSDIPPPPPPPPPPLPGPTPPEGRWYHRAWAGFRSWPLWLQIPVGVFVVLFLLGLVSSPFVEEDDPDTLTATTSATTATPTTERSTTTTEATTTTTETTEPPTTASTEPPTTAAPETTTTVTTMASPQAVMPVVPCGTNLQDAQDLVQDAGAFLSRSEDATGQGRNQVMDRNWTVIAQSPPPGTPIGEGDAVFQVVRNEEFAGC